MGLLVLAGWEALSENFAEGLNFSAACTALLGGGEEWNEGVGQVATPPSIIISLNLACGA